MIKKLLLNLIFVLLAAVQALAAEITIFHTNDIHCAVNEGVGVSSIAWIKQTYKSAGLPVVLVDAGDAVQGAPLGTLTQGQAIIRLMNATEYDFAIPGNHEFDYGMESFQSLSECLACGYHSVNITKEGKPMFPQYKLMDLGGEKVAFLGVTTPKTLTSANPVVFWDPKKPKKQLYGFMEKKTKKGVMLYQEVQKVIDQVKQEGATKVILVAHLGKTVDEYSVPQMLSQLTGVDAVIDGHSHEDYIDEVPDKTGKKVVVSQTGSRLHCLGRIRLTDKGVFADHIYQLAGTDEVVDEGLRYEFEVFNDTLMNVLGNSEFNLTIYNPLTKERLVRKQETNLGDLVADAFRVSMGTDLAVANGGGVRADIYQGTITYRDVLSVTPFLNKLCVVNITGKQLLDVLEFGARKYPNEFGGFLQVSGLSYTIDVRVPSSVVVDDKGYFVKVGGKRRVKDVLVGGKPLEKDKVYTLAGTEFVLRNGGDGNTLFRTLPLQRESMLMEADALMEYIHNRLHGVIPEEYIGYAGQGRIKIIGR